MNDHHGTNLSPLRVCAIAVFFTITAARASAQEFRWPEEPENLQVLSRDVKGAELGSVMRGFATSLGVRCEHCHVGDGPDLGQFDFASDEKPTKRKARLMLKMLNTLNDEYVSKLGEIEDTGAATLKVTCMTCHRKQARPVMLQDILTDSIESDGIDAAEARYRELREEYYGGFSFDFGPGALTGLGERLGKAGDFESAIRLLNLEIEMNGESPAIYFALGGIQADARLVADARESFTKGMELAPEGWKPFFQQKLDQLPDE